MSHCKHHDHQQLRVCSVVLTFERLTVGSVRPGLSKSYSSLGPVLTARFHILRADFSLLWLCMIEVVWPNVVKSHVSWLVLFAVVQAWL